MQQLLSITTVPVAYELRVKNATLEYSRGTADLEIQRDKGGLKIKSRPIRLNLDTFDARNSVVPTTRSSIEQAAQQGESMAYEATAQLAKEGQLLVKAKLGQDVFKQIDAQRNQLPNGDFNIGFIPNTGPHIEWSDPDMTIEYQMDKLNFDLKIASGNFEFIPGDIEIAITQFPDIQIEYIGSPIYVPPSAAESFVQIDVKA